MGVAARKELLMVPSANSRQTGTEAPFNWGPARTGILAPGLTRTLPCVYLHNDASTQYTPHPSTGRRLLLAARRPPRSRPFPRPLRSYPGSPARLPRQVRPPLLRLRDRRVLLRGPLRRLAPPQDARGRRHSPIRQAGPERFVRRQVRGALRGPPRLGRRPRFLPLLSTILLDRSVLCPKEAKQVTAGSACCSCARATPAVRRWPRASPAR